MPRQQLMPLVCLAAVEPGWEKGLGWGCHGLSQGWDAQVAHGAQLYSELGCEHLLHDPGLCQEPWGLTGSPVRSDLGEEGRDRDMDTYHAEFQSIP